MRHTGGVPAALLVLATAAALGGGVLAGPASASGPDHLKRSVGPIVSDAPAGTVCEFAYHEEDSFTANVVRFVDDSGSLARVENQTDLTVLHRNSVTGKTLVEEVHYAAHVDLVSEQVRQTGQTWHLRDENGRLVLSGAGLIEIDLVTGDVVRQTPHSSPELRTTVCPLLSGTGA